jgi:DNA-binding XRE family transcriptional regulator
LPNLEKNLTQAQWAEQLGATNKSISRWENGKTMMDLSLYEPLCKILDIQISELLYTKRLTTEEKTRQGEQSAL